MKITLRNIPIVSSVSSGVSWLVNFLCVKNSATELATWSIRPFMDGTEKPAAGGWGVGVGGFN